MGSEALDDRMEKLPEGCRFFDLNQLWYFPNRWAVRLLVPLPVTANHVTLLALALGMTAAACYFRGGEATLWGALFLYGKLFFDNVDGNLARVRGEESRLGRFLDSFSDFVVTALVYAAVTWHLARSSPFPGFTWTLGMLALLSAFMQCSYWVFYYVQYCRQVEAYDQNRPDESVTDDDRQAFAAGEVTALEFFLQRFHSLAYGWQDRIIEELDRVSRRWAGVPESGAGRRRWYGDRAHLTWMGPLCVCTNTMAFVVASLMDRMELFFFLVVFAMNGYGLVLHLWKLRGFGDGNP